MTRNFQTLGLTVVAMLAMSAFIAAGAQASGGGTFTVGAGSVPYTAHQAGGGHTVTLPGNRKMRCSSVTITGLITNGGTTTVASPLYAGCSIELGVGGARLPATVTTMSCQYHFTLTGPSGSEWIADPNIVCGANEDITISIYGSEEAHTKGETACEYTIASQPLTGVTFRNQTPTTLGILATAMSVTYIKIKGPIGA